MSQYYVKLVIKLEGEKERRASSMFTSSSWTVNSGYHLVLCSALCCWLNRTESHAMLQIAYEMSIFFCRIFHTDNCP